MRLDNLPEGPHTLAAYSSNISASQSFTVNSHFVIAELKTLSPTSQTYTANDTIQLTFTVNREIQSAHYYVYKGNDLVCDKALNGNSTIEQLPEGDYNLYLFVTTELGKTSETIHFSVSNSNQTANMAIVSGSAVVIALGISVCFVLWKKRKLTTDRAAK
jgi:hypothetical protein